MNYECIVVGITIYRFTAANRDEDFWLRLQKYGFTVLQTNDFCVDCSHVFVKP